MRFRLRETSNLTKCRMASKNNSPSPSLAPAARRLKDFFGWWGEELAALVPEKIRLWWREADRMVLVGDDHGRLTFSRPTDNRWQEVHAIETTDGSAARHRGEVERKLRQVIGASFSVMIALPPAKVLRRVVGMPLAVEENLRQALTFELDRYSPFKPDQVHFDFRVVERNTSQRRLSVELAIVPRTEVDRARAQLASLGLAVEAAVLADDVLLHRYRFWNFLPVSDRKPHRPPIGLRWRLALGLLASALLITLLALPIWQKRETVIALLEPVARARAAAKETDALRERLTVLTDEYNFLPIKKRASHSTVRMLDELSKLLPDDTFVIQLDFDGKAVQVHGETASATTLVQALEASPTFEDVSFKSQLVKVQGTPNDRFHLAATLETDETAKGTAPSAAVPQPANRKP
jgi:general secretion pathway protein L